MGLSHDADGKGKQAESDAQNTLVLLARLYTRDTKAFNGRVSEESAVISLSSA